MPLEKSVSALFCGETWSIDAAKFFLDRDLPRSYLVTLVPRHLHREHVLNEVCVVGHSVLRQYFQPDRLV